MAAAMARQRIHVLVTGRVQGVFFRSCTQKEATRLKLTGWVRNRPDGSVEAVVEGEAEAVDLMRAWFHKGSPMSMVGRVQVNEEEVLGDNRSFEIHYY